MTCGAVLRSAAQALHKTTPSSGLAHAVAGYWEERGVGTGPWQWQSDPWPPDSSQPQEERAESARRPMEQGEQVPGVCGSDRLAKSKHWLQHAGSSGRAPAVAVQWALGHWHSTQHSGELVMGNGRGHNSPGDWQLAATRRQSPGEAKSRARQPDAESTSHAQAGQD